MKLSVVTTLYHSASYINEFYERIIKELHQITEDYEIILVNDGSPDRSLDLSLNIFNKDSKVKIIDLSRNFGQHKSIMTGLMHAKGEYVFLIDIDLEIEPELLNIFWNEMQKNSNLDVVFGVQKKRKGNWFEKISGNIFFIFINLISEIPIPKNLVMIRLMKKHYVESLIKHHEREISLTGLFAITGFEQKSMYITKKHKGSTTYTLRRKINLAINTIVSYTNKPLVLIFYIGLVITIFSLFFILFLLLRRLLFEVSLRGWLSLIASIWLFGGLTIFFIGIVGIYLSKIFLEVKQRPLTIIKRIYEK